MLTFLKCHPEHLALLIPRAVRTADVASLDMAGARVALERSTLALSAWAGGRCYGAAGLLPWWDGCAQAWAILAHDSGPHMKRITQYVRFVLDNEPTRRIQLTVDCDYKIGHQWARMLGFEPEAERMRKYYPDGRDVALYARVRHDRD